MSVRWVAAAAALVAMMNTESSALAGEPAACAEAYEQSQRHRAAGQLISARRRLVDCVRGCGHTLRTDCEGWLNEVSASLPSVVLRVQDARGHDVSDVRVTLDGRLFVAEVTGRALDVDPGPHRLTFERAGARTELTVTIHEGEKLRSLEAILPATDPSAAAAASSVEPRPVPAAPSVPERPITLPVFFFSGLSLAALGGFVTFGTIGNEGVSSLRRCEPGCDRDEVASVRRDFLVADIALGVSVVSAAVAVYLFVTRPERMPSGARAASR